MPGRPLVAVFLLSIGLLAPWFARWRAPIRHRSDGAPTSRLVLILSCLNLVLAATLIALWLAFPGRYVQFGALWRHDIGSALLLGALAGLFMHAVGSGTPLPIASLTSVRGPAQRGGHGPEPHAVALLILGEIAGIIVWIGVGLPTLLRYVPRLVALPAAALGYGLSRAAAGEDHPAAAAIDALLLCLLYLFTRSLVAVITAHLLVDVLAYVGAATAAEEEELALEAGEPMLPARQ